MSFLTKILGIDRLLEEIRGTKEELREEIQENRGVVEETRGVITQEVQEIPEEVAEELQEVQEVTSKPTARKILKVIEEKGGRVNVTKLRNYCKENSICSRNTFYNYIDKLEQNGVIERVQDGRKKYVRNSNKLFTNV